MKQIALIHFLPLEYYPPATNMINYLSEELNSDIFLSVFSTHNTKKRAVYNNKSVKIYRTASSENTDYKFVRLWKYFVFQISVFFKLIIIRPEKILYYESLSSFPVFLYKRFIKHSTKIYIHYHEYVSPDEYANKSMATERFFHKLEQKFLYKNAVWISHTNTDRLNMFFYDNPNISDNILKEIPNYPPKSWKIFIPNKTSIQKSQLKCIYIGSLSLKNTYLKEFVTWVIAQNGKISFDIYTYNLNLETLNFLQNLKSPYINFNSNGIEYADIPSVLKKYNVGIIFYKSYSNNVVNCVSNKFYEYYVCNLNIWFSDIMKSTMKYTSLKSEPLVIPVNFKELNNFNWEKYEYNKITDKNRSAYFCDNIYVSVKKEFEK